MSREKNAHKLLYIDKVLSYVDSELSLIHLSIEHPEPFQQSDLQIFQSNLYIIPKSKGLGIIGLAEIVISIFLSKEIKDRNGKPASLIQLAYAFERIFNFSFGNIYDKRAEVFNRKPCNLTKALDFLRSTLERMKNNRSSENNEK